MNVYRLHHNGAVVNFYESLKDCAEAIKQVIKEHEDLEPTLIMNYQQNDKTVVIYRYWTNTTEMFMIEEIEK